LIEILEEDVIYANKLMEFSWPTDRPDHLVVYAGHDCSAIMTMNRDSVKDLIEALSKWVVQGSQLPEKL
jgi:hypothetical protein